MRTLWAAQWYSNNKLDGVNKHFLYANCLPKLFVTRSEAREYIKEKYGYIATRQDLRAEPHGWRVPRTVRVQILEVK
jgi:hypothetical protein